jgi:hypothetical protein
MMKMICLVFSLCYHSLWRCEVWGTHVPSKNYNQWVLWASWPLEPVGTTLPLLVMLIRKIYYFCFSTSLPLVCLCKLKHVLPYKFCMLYLSRGTLPVLTQVSIALVCCTAHRSGFGSTHNQIWVQTIQVTFIQV